jgi:hypothetical protein
VEFTPVERVTVSTVRERRAGDEAWHRVPSRRQKSADINRDVINVNAPASDDWKPTETRFATSSSRLSTSQSHRRHRVVVVVV